MVPVVTPLCKSVSRSFSTCCVSNHGVSSVFSSRFSHRTDGVWLFNVHTGYCMRSCCKQLDFVRRLWNLVRHLGKVYLLS